MFNKPEIELFWSGFVFGYLNYLHVTNISPMFGFDDMLLIGGFHWHDEEKQDLNHRNEYQDVIQMFD